MLLAGAALTIGGLGGREAGCCSRDRRPGYGFYTFYDGLPFMLWPDVPNFGTDGDE